MRKLALILALLAAPAFAEPVCRVKDADTLVIPGPSGDCKTEKTIRQFGADAVEKRHALGLEAKAFTEKLVQGRKIQLQDCQKNLSGGRKVCRIIVPTPGGKSLDLGRELIARGYAYHARKFTNKNLAYAKSLNSAEHFARLNRLGAWKILDSKGRPLDFRH